MAQDPKWKKAYDRLIREHYDDEKQVHLLQRQLRHFRSKRERLQNQIEEESKGMDVWMDMMDNLRRGLDLNSQFHEPSIQKRFSQFSLHFRIEIASHKS